MDSAKNFDFEVKIFGLTSEDKSESREFFLYKAIKEKFEDALYCRFNKGVGHIIMRNKGQDFPAVFSSAKTPPEDEDKEKKEENAEEPKKEEEKKEESDSIVLAKFPIKVVQEKTKEEKSLEVSVYNLSELEKEQFWRNHGKHFDSLLKQQFGQSIKYKPDGKANFVNTNVFLAGVKFKTLSEVRNMFKKLLKSKNANDKVEGLEAEMLKEIMKFHPKNAEKMKEFANFEVNMHPDYPDTKCFFTVDKEGTKKDFSYVKCLKRLADDISKSI